MIAAWIEFPRCVHTSRRFFQDWAVSAIQKRDACFCSVHAKSECNEATLLFISTRSHAEIRSQGFLRNCACISWEAGVWRYSIIIKQGPRYSNRLRAKMKTRPDSSACSVTWTGQTTEEPGKVKGLPSPVLGTTQPAVQWISWYVSPGVKRPVREPNSPLSMVLRIGGAKRFPSPYFYTASCLGTL